MKRVDFGDEIECLVAKREPVLIALYQPFLDLTITETLGPSYDSARDNAISKIKAFLCQATELKSQLIVLPEFTTPKEIIIDICKKKLKFSEGTLIIMPIEALSLSDYYSLTEEIRKTVSKFEMAGLKEPNPSITWVNACAIVAVTRNGIEVFIQPKRYASNSERDTLCCGNDYFVFNGNGITMSLFVCADANDSEIYLSQIRDTRNAAHGSYFVHTQWNRQPTHDLYNEFWRQIIMTDDNTLISLNWAAKSGIRKGNAIDDAIFLPLTRVACSGTIKRDDKYMTASTFTAFKSAFRENKHGTIFNLAYPHECCHFLTIRRPHEAVNDFVNASKTFLKNSCMYFSDDDTLIEYKREILASSFMKYIIDNYKDINESILGRVIALIFEDIEMFIASCLMEDKYKWLEIDVLKRPFIWASFFSSLGIPSIYSKDSIDLFATTIKKIDQCEALGYLIQPFETISMYPINLHSKEDNGYGWIFNCRGLSNHILSEKVSKAFQDIVGIPKGALITLFPTNCTAEFSADTFQKKILIAARDVSQPFDALSQDLDIRSPETRPKIRISAL